jgi:hypothetical protein
MRDAVTSAIHDQLWVEQVGGIVFAKLRGRLSPSLLEQCHHQVAELVRPLSTALVLYDALELSPPEGPLSLPASGPAPLPPGRGRRAITLADGRLRNPLRLAVSAAGGECRIFDNDLEAACAWLAGGMQQSLTSRSAP